MSATAPTIRDRVVIVGCGFGGLFAARTLGHADVDVTIGRTNHHLSQALLYQGNTSGVVGEVLDIDVEARRLTIDRLGQCDSIPYDSLIVATGATQSYFGHPEFQHNAPGLKSPALPVAALACGPSVQARWLRQPSRRSVRLDRRLRG